MYKFYYDHLKPTYKDDCKLLFTDTDSLCCHIQTPDLYRDMSEAIDHFDTSNFEPDHPLYSKKNHRVLGKMKSETGSTLPSNLSVSEPKCTAYCVVKKSMKKVKSIKKNYVKKHVRHENFLHILRNSSSTTKAKFRQFRSVNHNLSTIELNKICLSAIDDKRYILADGQNTLAYGHYSLQ